MNHNQKLIPDQAVMEVCAQVYSEAPVSIHLHIS